MKFIISIFFHFSFVITVFSQSNYDDIVIKQDKLKTENVFILGQNIDFFIKVLNTSNETKKDISINDFNFLRIGKLIDLVNGEEVVVEVNNSEAKSYLEETNEKSETLEYEESIQVQPNQENTKVFNRVALYRNNLDGGVFYEEIKGISSNEYPWLLKPSKYSVEIMCFLGKKTHVISTTIFFEVLQFPDEKTESDYTEYLKALKVDILESKKLFNRYTNYSITKEKGLWSYIKRESPAYINEALTSLLFPSDFQLKKEFKYRIELIEYVLGGFFEDKFKLNDPFLYRFFDTYFVYFLSKETSKKVFADRLLKALENRHPSISEIIIHDAEYQYGISGLTNYAASHK